MKIGTLYAIGVGPGDPELITLKAARILAEVDVVFAAASTKNDASKALDIARRLLRPDATVRRLDFPMTRDEVLLAAAWEKNALGIAETVESGRNAAFLTLGDPMTYSTFGYLLRTLKGLGRMPPLEVVPGITAYQAAAAKVGMPLAESEEGLAVISGVCAPEKLERLLDAADNAVILKAYRGFPAIREAVRALRKGHAGAQAVFVTRLGLDGEAVFRDIEDVPDAPHYLSLVLIKKRPL